MNNNGSYVELNDEELDRKIMADLANFSYDEDEESVSASQYGDNPHTEGLSGAVLNRGSIFFDDYIKRQNERMQQDQEENEKELLLYKQLLQKNNERGQEIFDEMDKDLANVRKMMKVIVKPDVNVVDGSATPKQIKRKKFKTKQNELLLQQQQGEDQQQQQSQPDVRVSLTASAMDQNKADVNQKNNKEEEGMVSSSEYDDDILNEESFIEIDEGFGEKTKYRPDVITQSQYLSIKEKAREEARLRAQEMVFAEDKIKQQFMEEQGMFSDEDSIMSGEIFEDDGFNKLRPLSRVDSLEDLPSHTHTHKSRGVLQSNNKRTTAVQPPHTSTTVGTATIESLTDSPVVRKTKKTFKNMNNNSTIAKNSMRSSQIKYELVMSGQKPLKSSITASAVFKQQLEAKLEAKQDRMAQERELFAMDNEDFLSMEYEDAVQRKAFALKDYKLPDEFVVYKEIVSPQTYLHLEYHDTHVGEIHFDAPLSLNGDNLLTRDSLQMCLQDLAKRSSNNNHNRKRSRGNTKTIENQQSKLSFIEVASQKGSGIDTHTQVVKIQTQQQQQNKQSNNKQECVSLAGMYRSRLEGAREKVLQRYLSTGLLQQIESISRQYEPKLIGSFVDQANENIILQDDDDDDSQVFGHHNNKSVVVNQQRESFVGDNNGVGGRSLKQLLSTDVFGTFQKKRRLEIKLERISDLSGIGNLPMLESVNLSVNRIQDISALLELKSSPSSNISRIVELSLSQNNIIDYSSVSVLVSLRSLNLELNRIESMCDLSACIHLEQFNLNSNRITAISPSISNNKQLRRFSVFKNQITGNVGDVFAGNLFLEELDISRNRIASISGLQKRNLLLKKLVASYNEIREIPDDFAFIFLVELWLNGNQLRDLSGFTFLPCLSYLNVGENKIQTFNNNNMMLPLLPNLTQLLVNYNQITHFESLFNLLRASPNLKYLSFNANPFIEQANLTDDCRDLYDYLLLRHLPRIRELNHVAVEMGRVKYLERRFSTLVKKKVMLDEDIIQSFLSEFNLITRQHSLLYMQKKQRKDSLFAQTLAFHVLDSTFTMMHVKRMLVAGSPTTTMMKRNDSSKIQCLSADGVFFRKDFFENKVKKSIHRIKGLALKVLHRIRVKKAFYARNTTRIIQIQSWFRGWLIRKIVNFEKIFSNRRQHRAAVMIQKVFRGFRLRKKKEKLFGKIKYEDDDDLPEIDDDWLNQPQQDYDTGLSIPNGFDVMSFLNQPNQNNNSSSSSRATPITTQNHNIKQSNNFMTQPNTEINKAYGITGSMVATQQENTFMSNQNGKKNQQQQHHHIVAHSALPLSSTSKGGLITPKINSNKVALQSTQGVLGFLPTETIQKSSLLPPIGGQPLLSHHRNNNNTIGGGGANALQNNNFMRNQTNNQQSQQQIPTGNYLNTQKARLHSQRSQGDSSSETNSVVSQNNNINNNNPSLSNSGFSYKSEHVRKPAMSMVSVAGSSSSSSSSSQVFPPQRKSSSKPQLAPVKSVKVSEEEKQKIMDEWGFTKPEVVQTFAYRLEKSRRNKVKSLPLTAEQRYDKFVQSTKQKK